MHAIVSYALQKPSRTLVRAMQVTLVRPSAPLWDLQVVMPQACITAIAIASLASLKHVFASA